MAEDAIERLDVLIALRFSLRGSCLLRASLRAFGSRENGICDGPTELRGGRVIEPGRDGTGVGGVTVGGGEEPRGLFCRFSSGLFVRGFLQQLWTSITWGLLFRSST